MRLFLYKIPMDICRVFWQNTTLCAVFRPEQENFQHRRKCHRAYKILWIIIKKKLDVLRGLPRRGYGGNKHESDQA